MVQYSEKESQASAGRAEYENGKKKKCLEQEKWDLQRWGGSRRSQAEQEESWESPVELKGVQRKRRDLYERENTETAEIRGRNARHSWRKWIKKHQGWPLAAAVPILKKSPSFCLCL